MKKRQYLYQYRPVAWLISDARNDAVLEGLLARLPRGSGFIFRHYHLAQVARRARFDRLARIARRYGHSVVLSGSARQARRWGADGAYGAGPVLASGPAMPRLVTVHSLKELRKARRADAVLLSPVFSTRSHPGAKPLGSLRFRLLATHAQVPAIALGGMTAKRARQLGRQHGIQSWAAIDRIISA
jgi:thiamine-phosphate pyrophosphorylase